VIKPWWSRTPSRSARPSRSTLTGPWRVNRDRLIRSCQGIDTLLHTASYVGTDLEQATAANDHGTTALLREATRAGVRHIIYISTAAVYGHGPHHNVEPEHLTPAPLSPASQTRLAAENTMRPLAELSYDPTSSTARATTGSYPNSSNSSPYSLLNDLPRAGHVKLSTIAVDNLASVLTGLITVVTLSHQVPYYTPTTQPQPHSVPSSIQ
jgi:nucleoside-diphosphate-sugar epimerase